MDGRTPSITQCVIGGIKDGRAWVRTVGCRYGLQGGHRRQVLGMTGICGKK